MTDNGEFYGVHCYEELTDACDKVDADIHAYMEKTGKNDDLKPIGIARIASSRRQVCDRSSQSVGRRTRALSRTASTT